jgi:hypothetical protein
MTRSELEHLIRAAAEIANDDGIVVIRSGPARARRSALRAHARGPSCPRP